MTKKTRKKSSRPTKSLFDAPSAQASTSEKADYLEVLALRETDHDVSEQDLIEIGGRADEEEPDKDIPGVESDLALENQAAETLDEHKQRLRDLGLAAKLYPYDVERDLLSVRSDLDDSPETFLYWFLLFATRLNMRDDRTHAGIDGAELFARLSLEVAIRYLGGPTDVRVESLLFGTARHNLEWVRDSETRGRFGENVNILCTRLGEGICFRPKDKGSRINAKDDKLDVVVWRNFSDKKCGKLIAFGQCKTGSNWVAEMPRLNPDAFCRRWWHDQPAVTPIKLFFVADRAPEAPFFHASEAGIFFDRCRILEHATTLPANVLDGCAKWTRAVMGSHGIEWSP